MNLLGKTIIGVAGGLTVLAGIGWVGLQILPSNFPPPNDTPKDLGMVDLPADLPTPVRRFYETAYSDRVLRVESLIVLGRAHANFGIWLPLRFRLVHQPGYTFERYMEVTWFGQTVLKAIDQYIDGRGMTGPISNAATGPAIDQGANMILWAEAPLMPSLWITDKRIRWEAIDNTSARLLFPFRDTEDELTAHFDTESGLVTRITALRFRDAESGKIPWHADFLTWQRHNGAQVPARIAITWEDHGKPWSYWELEDYYWNVDIAERFSQKPAFDDSHIEREIAGEFRNR